MTSSRLAATLCCALAIVAAPAARAQAPAAGAPSATPAITKPAAPAPTGPPSTVTVYVAGQGEPIPGVKVTLAPDIGRPPEQWNQGDAPALAVVTTDATGHALFAKVPPGKWIATTTCNVPGNWIAGNYASRLETFAGRPAQVMLTMRHGGMIRARAMTGDRPAGRCEVRVDSPDAMGSACGTMSPSLVDTSTGTFTIAKVPVNASVWVKVGLNTGPGLLSVWKVFNMTKPETLDAVIPFPALNPKDVGSLIVHFRADLSAPMDSGSATFLMTKPDGAWRYEVSADVGGADTLATLHGVPAGGYQMTAKAYPGEGKWWSAGMDSAHVVAGKSSDYVLHARSR